MQFFFMSYGRGLFRLLRHSLVLICGFLSAGAMLAQNCPPGELRVIVLDSQKSPVRDTSVRVGAASISLGPRSTQTTGLADFPNIPCGSWTVTVTSADFETVTQAVEIAGAKTQEIRIVLTPKMVTTSVDVKDSAPAVQQQSASENHELRPVEVKALPSNPATVNDTLPLVPGIVRGRDGELKIDGAGQERSAMVVNQTDITDPATGRFGQSIPVDSIESVNVLNTPFLAQYGRFTQSVVAVETRRGGEKWHAELNDPFPDFRVRSFHLRGIRNETPRFVVGGPLLRNRVYFITALQYFLDKVPSRTLGFPFNESKKQAVNSFSQLDLILSARQFITATLHISPQHTNFVNPDFFTPQPAAPSYAQHNYAGTIIDHFGVLRGIVDSSVSIQRYDVAVGAQGDANMILTPVGTRGNFFGAQNRSARRTEWLETWSLAPFGVLGTHLLKMGVSVTGSGNEGRFRYRPVNIVDLAGLLEQRIDFTNPNPFNRTDLEVTAYAQDHWAVTRSFSFDYGGRVEHQRLAASLRLAPRAGFSWSPFQDQRTVLRAGYGLFYDHLPLEIYTFSRYPQRIITTYAPDGTIIGAPVLFNNVIGSSTGPRSFFVNGQQVAGAFSPRGATLNLQLEHTFAPLFGAVGLRVRGVYTDNRSVGLVVFEPGTLGPASEIVLNGDGKSRYRQAEVTAKFSWKENQQVVLSYTHSRAEGNLNNFDSFLGNFPTLLVRPNLYSNLPADLPNRFVLWGSLQTHVWGLQILPIVEYRNGFPYVRLDERQNYVGVPNSDATRFPHFFAADARLVKDLKVSPKYTFRISVTGTNLTNHFNALAIHNNSADPQCGIFFGNYQRRYRGDFEVIF
jgi:hypothetical protein